MTSTTAAVKNANVYPSKKQLNSFSTVAAAANHWCTSQTETMIEKLGEKVEILRKELGE